MAESINAFYKAELITTPGPGRNIDDVELATLSLIHWWNPPKAPRLNRQHGTRRVREALDDRTTRRQH